MILTKNPDFCSFFQRYIFRATQWYIFRAKVLCGIDAALRELLKNTRVYPIGQKHLD